MSDITITILALSFIGLLMCAIFGIGEIAGIPLVRTPKQQSFKNIRMKEEQYANIVAPALGALVSGLFVSISASYFYAGLVNGEKPNIEILNIEIEHQSFFAMGGVLFFIGGAVALVFTLKAALKGVGEPHSIANDPFSIRAAAREYAENPKGAALDPQLLNLNLKEWTKFICVRSLHVTKFRSAPRLDKVFKRGEEGVGALRALLDSLLIYVCAVTVFPLQFCLPIVTAIVFSVSGICYIIFHSGIDVSSAGSVAKVVIFFLGIGALPAVFYCIARGNRARLLYQIHLEGLDNARHEINRALKVKSKIDTQNVQLERLIEGADLILEALESQAPRRNILDISIGRFHLKMHLK